MIQRFYDLVNENAWTFAKSMKYIPHWYVVRDRFKNDEDFVFMVEYIRQYGVKEKFGKREFIYFYLNGFKYWTMGHPINLDGKPHTIIINRAKYTIVPNDYDIIANVYGKLFSQQKYKDEDKELFKLITPHIHGSVMDIGCGGGVSLDYIPEFGVGYHGCDSSIKMLEELKKKDDGLIHLSHDYFRNIYYQKFDLILALYGTASYFTDADVRRVTESLSEGGKYFLMTYLPGIIPVTHKVFGMPYYENNVKMPFGSIETVFGDYVIHTNFEL